MKIKNIEQLREFVLESLEKLSANKIDVTEAGVIAKSSETIMSSLKLQLSYSGMLNETPNIKFLQDCHKGTSVIDHEKQKAIEQVKKAK